MLTVDPVAQATIRRVSYRLLPFLMLAYLVCYIDRVNAGFAALQMNKALGISPATFGLGGGIFFVSVLPVRSSLQPRSCARRGSAMDRADHDLVGAGLWFHGYRRGS